MSRLNIYDVLEVPWVYRFVQSVATLGAKTSTRREVEGLLARLPRAADVLDVGCGPSSRLWNSGLDPVGVDVSPRYVEEFKKRGRDAKVGPADNLPFASGSFDSAWTFGLLHHLDDSQANRCLAEMIRVVRPGGSLIVFDAVLPEPAWRRPLAWALRRLDRGNFMRHEQDLVALFPHRDQWHFKRRTYTLTGLERLVCTLVCPTD